MNKQYWKVFVKTLLTTASFITLEAPHLSYANVEQHTLSAEAISKHANAFLDALEKENPGYSYDRDRVYNDILKGSLVLKNIQRLPQEVGNLKNLAILVIRESEQLAALPETIGNLKNLETLGVLDSELINLPETISELQALETLYLYGNKKMTNLPKGIERLNKNLQIYLRDTPLSKLYGGVPFITLEKFLEKREIITKGTFVYAALEPNSQKKPKALKGLELGRLPKELRQHIVNDMAAASAKDKNPPPANSAPGVPTPKG
jgi:Leucine-rich repeat (LRR) protein